MSNLLPVWSRQGMVEPFALDSDLNDSPTIIGPTPPKRRTSQSVRRLNFDFDSSRFMSSTPRSSSGSNEGVESGLMNFHISSQAETSPSTTRSGPITSFNSSLEHVLAEICESNRYLKDLSNRMDGIDKRLKFLEDADADDEDDDESMSKRQKKQKIRKLKHKRCGPSKEIRVCCCHACMFS